MVTARLIRNPIHEPLKHLEQHGWDVDYEKLCAIGSYAPTPREFILKNFCALDPVDDRIHIDLRGYLNDKKQFGNSALSFLSCMQDAMQEEGMKFEWGEPAMFSVTWNIVSPELFHPNRAIDLANMLSSQISLGQRFMVSCAHVLTSCTRDVIKVNRKWIVSDGFNPIDLVHFCLVDATGKGEVRTS